MEKIPIKEKTVLAVDKMREAIKKGKIVIYPTDTCYGIGGNALDKKVVTKIYEIKNRSKNNPLSVIVRDMDMIEEYCKITPNEKKKIKKYLPGPYTLLLNRNKKKIPVSNLPRLGIRIPRHSFIQKVMEGLDVPIITTSANISGEMSPNKVEDISKKIIKSANLILDGGETQYGHPSTVIDIPTGKVLRDCTK